MAFQQIVQHDLGFNVAGEIYSNAPSRVKTARIFSADASYNVIGATFFTVDATTGVASAGGTIAAGVAAFGILANPKGFSNNGQGGAALAPTMKLANNEIGQFAQEGEWVVAVPAPCVIGDIVIYETTTGALGTMAVGGTLPVGYAEVPNCKIITPPQAGASGGLAVCHINL